MGVYGKRNRLFGFFPPLIRSNSSALDETEQEGALCTLHKEDRGRHGRGKVASFTVKQGKRDMEDVKQGSYKGKRKYKNAENKDLFVCLLKVKGGKLH